MLLGRCDSQSGSRIALANQEGRIHQYLGVSQKQSVYRRHGLVKAATEAIDEVRSFAGSG